MSRATLHYRAQIAAHSRAAQPDQTRIREARQGLAEARIAEYIEKTAATIAPLTPEARTRLAVLLLAQSNAAAPKDAA